MGSDKAHDLSHIRYEDGKDHSLDKVAIVVSRWNPQITNTLWEGALETLLEAGVKRENIKKVAVPGTFELPSAADILLHNNPKYDGIICIGCVIQGETRHFEFIAEAVSHGIINASIKHHKPIIFGVLTPDTMQQALDRAGGKYGNKGEEAAVAFLQMVDMARAS